MMKHVAESSHRMLVRSGRVLQLPEGCTRLKVIVGMAWITADGKDIIVPTGKQRVVEAAGPVLISGLGSEDLIVEVRSVPALQAA